MDMIDSVAFILSGFAVVLVALSLLWAVCALTGRLLAFGAGSKRPSPAVAQPKTRPTPTPSPSIPPAHLAAISAAVAVITGGRGRIVSVHVPAHLASAWASDGRTEHSSSHRVRWDWAVTGPPHVDQNSTTSSTPPAPAAASKRTT